MISKIKEWIQYLTKGIPSKYIIYIVIIGGITMYWFWHSFSVNGVLTEFPAQLFRFSIGACALLLYDMLVLKDTDTNEMVKQGNNWGLFMVALALLWMGSK